MRKTDKKRNLPDLDSEAKRPRLSLGPGLLSAFVIIVLMHLVTAFFLVHGVYYKTPKKSLISIYKTKKKQRKNNILPFFLCDAVAVLAVK